MRTSRRSSSTGVDQQHDRRTALHGHGPGAEGEAGALVVVIDGIADIEAARGPAGLSEVLRVAGQRIRLTLRADDFSARWGGEELVVVLRNVSIDRAVEVGQRIRMAISQPVDLADARSLVPTCAVGAAAGDPDRVEALIERAHQALQLAQDSGGNCVRRALPLTDRWTAGAANVA